MGTNLSVANDGGETSSPDPWWQETRRVSSSSADMKPTRNEEQRSGEESAAVAAVAPTASSSIYDRGGDDARQEENQKRLETFRQELATKREARRKAIAALTDKLKRLQHRVDAEENGRLSAERQLTRLKELVSEGGLKEELEREKDRATGLERELDNERKLRLRLEKEREDAEEKEQQIYALKEVASIGKEMLRIRELQVNELKKKLCETQYPEDLREEYETQIENVRRLKTLYEERAETVRLEHQREIEREATRIQALETKIAELEDERKEAEVMREHLKDRVLKLDQELEERNDAAMALQEQLDASVIECRDLTSQMSLINNLFSQMLVGNLNLEQITRLVEENQSLVIDLTSDDKKNDLAALFIDIAKQLDDNSINDSTENLNNNEVIEQLSINCSSTSNNNNNNGIITQQDVALNLSKVWRILVQLLTQDQGSSTPSTAECDSESCYKSVETPSGKRSVISVSQTFLTLKNLILEKNSLIKEVNKLKLLNEHLETRLGNQEKRLSTVSTELKKTWGVVSKLRVQHKQLHTQEKILKYELQHKRLLLNDLKDELERCKEIWDMARQKNYQSEEEWRKLRKEFADRRKNAEISNSAESGYEDDEPNSPPTEDSIDEQELLDNLIDPENDALLLINKELPSQTVETKNENNNDLYNDQDNYTEDSTELSEIDAKVHNKESVTNEHKGLNTEENDTTETKLLKPLISEACKITLDEEPSPPETEKSSTADTSAENISRFLEGLLEPDDSPQNYELNISINSEVTGTILDRKSNSPGTNHSLVQQTSKNDTLHEVVNEAHVRTQDSKTQKVQYNLSKDLSTNFESCSETSTKSSHDIEIQRLTVKPPTIEGKKTSAESNLVDSLSVVKNVTQDLNSGREFKNSVGISEIKFANSTDISQRNFQKFSEISEINLPNSSVTCERNPENSTEISERNFLNSSAISFNNINLIDEESGKLDEACGYSPSYSSVPTTFTDLPSVQEVLGRLNAITDEPAESSASTSHSDRRLRDDNRTTEEVLDARTERLKRLEEQCKSLFNKVTATTIKSNVLSSKLELLHEQYGRSTESYDDITPSMASQQENIEQRNDKPEENKR